MNTDATTSQEHRTNWKLVTFTFMGFYWAVDFLIRIAAAGFEGIAVGSVLALLGFGAITLEISSRRIWRRIAFWVCVFEVCVSPLLWLGFMVHFADPFALRVRVLGFPIASVESGVGMFLYCLVRATLFAFAAYLVSSAPYSDENRAAS